MGRPSKKTEGEEGTQEVTRVVFTRKDGSTREFTPELHGENFEDIADEFEKTNQLFIQDRKDI